MRFRKYKPCALNESLLGNCNMDSLEGDTEIEVVAPPVYAAAINDHERRQEKIEDDMKEFSDSNKEFADDSQKREVDTETTKEMKDMKLTEATEFTEPELLGKGCCAPTLWLPSSRELSGVFKSLGSSNPDEREYAKDRLKEILEHISDCRKTFANFDTYWDTHYTAADNAMNEIEDVIKEALGPDSVTEFFDVKPDINIDAGGQSVGILSGQGGPVTNEDIDDDIEEFFDVKPNINLDASGQSVGILGGSGGSVTNEGVNEDPHFFQVDDTLTESPAAVAEPPVKKKRSRGPNEKKWIGNYSSEDLWLAVYDELSATTDNEGPGAEVNKQIKARRGSRYEHVYPHGDNDIVIYATKPEEFDFARQVVDHYGVTADEPKMDNNRRTNGTYKYSMVIHIPEEGLYHGE